MSLNPAFPNDLARAGGSRGWRRHVRRWKSAHTLAARGDKTARAWLTEHHKPVPAHPHERPLKKTTVPVQPNPVEALRPAKRLIWAGLPSADSRHNSCPACGEDAGQSGYKDTDEGARLVLTCLDCGCNYRAYVAPITSRDSTRSAWWG